MNVTQEVARIKRECSELGITPSELCSMVHVKKALITSWAYRYKSNPQYRPRQSVLLQMNEKLKDLREKQQTKQKQSIEHLGMAVTTAPTHFDDETPIVD